MIFTLAVLEGIARGDVTLAFRRASRPPARAGATLRTAVGIVRFDEVASVDEADVTAADARRAGFASLAALFASLRPEGTLFRVRLASAGPDPRAALREALPNGAEIDALRARLAAMDARSAAPWTLATLRLVGERPGTLAQTLADALGQERLAFKARVRKLKDLGLTESLEVGYRLAPRGRALLDALAG